MSTNLSYVVSSFLGLGFIFFPPRHYAALACVLASRCLAWLGLFVGVGVGLWRVEMGVVLCEALLSDEMGLCWGASFIIHEFANMARQRSRQKDLQIPPHLGTGTGTGTGNGYSKQQQLSVVSQVPIAWMVDNDKIIILSESRSSN